MIFMRVLVAVSVKYMLKSKNDRLVFIGTNSIQSPTNILIADKLLMRFMTQTMIYTMVLTKVTVGVVLD